MKPEDQTFTTGGDVLIRREWTPQRMVANDKLAAAYHLAVGSHGTANDLIDITSNPVMEDELKNLAANFLRISELLVEAGFRP